MSARWWTGGVWALAAGSALFWAFKVFVSPPPVPPHTRTAQATVALRGDVSRVLGAEAPPPAASAAAAPAPDARFQLIGVVSPRPANAAREGLALIAVDGKPAKAFRVGAVVEGNTVLQGVAARGATLGPRGGAATVALNLAPVAAAATGVLPGVGAPAAPVQAAPGRLRSPPGVVMRPPVPVPGEGEGEPLAQQPPSNVPEPAPTR